MDAREFKQRRRRLSASLWFGSLMLLASFMLHAAAPPAPDAPEKEDGEAKQEWSVEAPPGPLHEQSIDATEGTWLTVSVSPDGG